jgi:hypothetical protein
MAYTNIDLPTDYFNTVLWTGNGADDRSITGVGFQPDFVWLKERSSTSFHTLQNAIVGVTKHLFSNSALAEITDNSNRVQAFESDGFQVGSDGTVNESGQTYVAWNWLANGTGVSNTSGTISSTVSANTTSGFSIVSYTGNASNSTIGHSLGKAPSMIIVKNRSAVEDWTIYHSTLGNTKFMDFTTGAEQTSSSIWNNTSPTSTLFTVGTNSKVNGNTNSMIAYCFAEVKGYSKFGSYTGNGNADGTFVYTGFTPAFVIIKPSSYSNSWLILDNKRNTFNPVKTRLEADGSGADSSTLDYADFLSNGFKIRTSNGHPNTSGGTLIYMAFAENPFVSSTGIPTTAR